MHVLLIPLFAAALALTLSAHAQQPAKDTTLNLRSPAEEAKKNNAQNQQIQQIMQNGRPGNRGADNAAPQPLKLKDYIERQGKAGNSVSGTPKKADDTQNDPNENTK